MKCTAVVVDTSAYIYAPPGRYWSSPFMVGNENLDAIFGGRVHFIMVRKMERRGPPNNLLFLEGALFQCLCTHTHTQPLEMVLDSRRLEVSALPNTL